MRCRRYTGLAADAVRALGGTLAVEMNAAAENPLVDAASGDIIHNGNFYTAYLGLALDAARTALFQTAALSAARLGTLVEPAITGLRPFLACSAPASSGVLSLEYVAHSALADIRRLASPGRARDRGAVARAGGAGQLLHPGGAGGDRNRRGVPDRDRL